MSHTYCLWTRANNWVGKSLCLVYFNRERELLLSFNHSSKWDTFFHFPSFYYYCHKIISAQVPNVKPMVSREVQAEICVSNRGKQRDRQTSWANFDQQQPWCWASAGRWRIDMLTAAGQAMTTKVSISPFARTKMTTTASDSHRGSMIKQYWINLHGYIGLPTSTYSINYHLVWAVPRIDSR